MQVVSRSNRGALNERENSVAQFSRNYEGEMEKLIGNGGEAVVVTTMVARLALCEAPYFELAQAKVDCAKSAKDILAE